MDNDDLRDDAEEAYWADLLSPAGQTRKLGGHAALLAEQLNALGHEPRWRDASQLGVELVDHPDNPAGIFHLANGDIVYPTEDGYEVLVGARSGDRVLSGTMRRVHNAEISPSARIHPTAMVDPSARVEAGAVIAPHAYVGPHAHVGRNTYIGQATHIAGGAFIGIGSTVRGGCIIGEGAVVGAGSDLGSCTRLGDGAQIDQATTLDSHTNITGGDKITPASTRRQTNTSPATQLAHAVERLLTMDRE